jgi:predicted Rossmann fold flavoprotein
LFFSIRSSSFFCGTNTPIGFTPRTGLFTDNPMISELSVAQSFPPPLDLLILGGGPAGFFAALTCAETSTRLGHNPPRILILEKTPHPLGKVLISGGGRCNLTHACFEPAELISFYPRGGRALRSAFTRFQPADTIAWFVKHGVDLKTEADGRVFPLSDSARSVVDCLLQAAQEAGIVLRTHASVKAIEVASAPHPRFQVHLPESSDLPSILSARYLLLAPGGSPASLRLAEALGHTIEPPVPSLFTFTVPDARLEELAGVSVSSAGLRLLDENGVPPRLPGMLQEGPLLITHWGLSGPAVLRLSSWGARWLHERRYKARLAVNWLHPQRSSDALAFLQAHKNTPAQARQKAIILDPFQRLPQRLWRRLALTAGVDEDHNWGDLSKAVLQRLSEELTNGQFAIRGKGPFKEEFVTCGGVRLDEVDFKTMQSRRIPGLYFAGEVLDVDGLTGGFNFQNAWTTGYIAGTAIAKFLS